MSAHAVSDIRAKFPDAMIDWLVESRCAPVIDERRLVNGVIVVPRQRWKGKPGPSSWVEQIRFHQRLMRSQYDVAIDLQGHTKTALCLRLVRSPRKLAAKATDVIGRMMNPIARPAEPGTHMVERLRGVVSEVLPVAASGDPLMPELKQEQTMIESQLTSRRPLVTITVGAGQPDKKIAPVHISFLGERLVGMGYQVALLGGPGEARPSCPGAMDWVGKLSLRESMAAIVKSAVHISGDTGNGHVAAAYGIPTISVFGPTDPARFRPYSDHGRVLQVGSETDSVSAEAILESVLEVLEGRGAAVPR
jgi:ADP-heptose:LPS heptosyltransferase